MNLTALNAHSAKLTKEIENCVSLLLDELSADDVNKDTITDVIKNLQTANTDFLLSLLIDKDITEVKENETLFR